MAEDMRILGLKAENYKRLKAVEIKPEGNVVVISGKNNQGKTSLIDSIWAVLDARTTAEKPIREGEKKASSEIDLGAYKAKRTFTEKGNYLTVETSDGAQYRSPQKLLDDFVGHLSFDPLEFARMEGKEQAEILSGLVTYNLDDLALKLTGQVPEAKTDPIGVLDRKRKEIYDNRSNLNRDLTSAQKQLEALPEVEPATKISAKDLVASKEAIQAKLNQGTELRDSVEAMQKDILRFDQLIPDLEKELAEAQTKLDQEKTKREMIYEELNEAHAKMEASNEYMDDLGQQMAAADKQISEVDEVNSRAETFEKRAGLQQSYDKLKKETDQLTADIAQIDQVKTKLVAEADMPIDGLTFDGQTAAFDGIPVSQLSDSEKLKISMSIAMALNPKLKVIRITDGSLLDSQSMSVIQDIASKNGFQVWMEIVDEGGKIGFYIEEGEVLAVDGEAVPAPPAKDEAKPEAKPEPTQEPAITMCAKCGNPLVVDKIKQLGKEVVCDQCFRVAKVKAKPESKPIDPATDLASDVNDEPGKSGQAALPGLETTDKEG